MLKLRNDNPVTAGAPHRIECAEAAAVRVQHVGLGDDDAVAAQTEGR
jgi:hypothetical protein